VDATGDTVRPQSPPAAPATTRFADRTFFAVLFAVQLGWLALLAYGVAWLA
jgi:hypothetical protein